tara:strand:- start:73 stop:591 length:519 start_codon:yes stop_codon:yes gene_type:complete
VVEVVELILHAQSLEVLAEAEVVEAVAQHLALQLVDLCFQVEQEIHLLQLHLKVILVVKVEQWVVQEIKEELVAEEPQQQVKIVKVLKTAVLAEQEQHQVLQVHQLQELVEEEVCHLLPHQHLLQLLVDQVAVEQVEYAELLQVQEQLTLAVAVVEQVVEDHQIQVVMVDLV